MPVIRVVKAFTEVRTGSIYAPGDVVADPQYYADGDRRAEARAARGQVRLEAGGPTQQQSVEIKRLLEAGDYAAAAAIVAAALPKEGE